jgi:hypothetical protein
MVIYQVNGAERLRVEASFLKILKEEQVKCIKGVYGWYILSTDLDKLCPGNDFPEEGDQRIYLYVGTVKGGCVSSVTARFIGELSGAQISTDKGAKFDTDFAVSLVIAFFCEKGIDVYFDVLSETHGNVEEVRIGREKQPLLQKEKRGRLSLHDDIKKKIAGRDMAGEMATVSAAVLDRLRERLYARSLELVPASLESGIAPRAVKVPGLP